MSKKIPVQFKDVRKAETPPPDTPTLKYLGTDKHDVKLATGKFGSNVAPRRAGQGQKRPSHWICYACDYENRDYHKTCFKCNEYTRPF